MESVYFLAAMTAFIIISTSICLAIDAYNNKKKTV